MQSLGESRTQIADHINFNNDMQRHSAIDYVAPKDKLDGNDTQISRERAQKLEAAREAWKKNVGKPPLPALHQMMTNGGI